MAAVMHTGFTVTPPWGTKMPIAQTAMEGPRLGTTLLKNAGRSNQKNPKQ